MLLTAPSIETIHVGRKPYMIPASRHAKLFRASRFEGVNMQELTEIEPLGARDEACLADLYSVLERHGALDRFGLTLLHDHFEVDDAEILIETCDPESRTLSISVER